MNAPPEESVNQSCHGNCDFIGVGGVPGAVKAVLFLAANLLADAPTPHHFSSFKNSHAIGRSRPDFPSFLAFSPFFENLESGDKEASSGLRAKPEKDCFGKQAKVSLKAGLSRRRVREKCVKLPPASRGQPTTR